MFNYHTISKPQEDRDIMLIRALWQYLMHAENILEHLFTNTHTETNLKQF